jgi:hypothetical protein
VTGKTSTQRHQSVMDGIARIEKKVNTIMSQLDDFIAFQNTQLGTITNQVAEIKGRIDILIQKLATAGSQPGLSPGQVQAMANASAEAAAISKSLGAIDTEVALPSTTVPVVSSISPATGVAAGGDSVTINGSGLTGATAVSIGGVPVASFTVASDTSITAVTAAGTVGSSQSVQVTGPNGVSDPNTLFALT